jgi:arabinose-5-phosphate isomerase
MTASALTISKEQLAWDALKLMQRDPKKLVMMLPVLEQGRVIGILRMHDLVQAGIS